MSDWFARFLLLNPVFRKEDLLKAYSSDVSDEDPAKPGLRNQARKLLQTKTSDLIEIRRILFAAKEKADGATDWPDPYLVASRAFEEKSVLIGETALRFWLNEDPPPRLLVATSQGQRKWPLRTDGGGKEWPIRPVEEKSGVQKAVCSAPLLQVKERFGMKVQVTTRERTLVDALDLLPLASDPFWCWRNLARLFSDGHQVNLEHLEAYRESIKSKVGTLRLAFFLDLNQESLGIPIRYINGLRKDCPKGITRWLDNYPGTPVWEWSLIAPRALQNLEGPLIQDPEAFEALIQTVADANEGLAESENSLDSGNLDAVEEPSAHEDADDFDPDRPAHLPALLESTETPSSTDISNVRWQTDDLLPLLAERFGYDHFRKGQAEAIKSILMGKDTLAILPTGSGKSLIYQYLTMKSGGMTIVISPLIALIEDQIEEATKRPRNLIARHYNPKDESKFAALKEEMNQGQVDLLFMSPEAFRASTLSLRKYTKNVKLVVVDEAHCISAWGHDFRPAFRELHNLRTLFPGQPVLAVTATASTYVENSIVFYLKMNNPSIYRESIARRNLRIKAMKVKGSLKDRCEAVIDFIQERKHLHGVIFCSTRTGTESVAQFLRDVHQLDARHFHAGMSRPERAELLAQYRRPEPAFKIMVATIAFGMGINEDRIRWVLHLNLPASTDSYVQEIGRAGRDSRGPADCLLVHSYGDVMFRMGMSEKIPETYRGVVQGHIKAMDRVASVKKCRHRELIRYFEPANYKTASPCGDRCDVCCQEKGADVFYPPLEPLPPRI